MRRIRQRGGTFTFGNNISILAKDVGYALLLSFICGSAIAVDDFVLSKARCTSPRAIDAYGVAGQDKKALHLPASAFPAAMRAFAHLPSLCDMLVRIRLHPGRDTTSYVHTTRGLWDHRAIRDADDGGL